MQKSSGKIIAYSILLGILFIGLIRIILLLPKKILVLEALGLLLLLLLSLIGFIGCSKGWGERVLFFVFLFYLINIVLIRYFLNSLYFVLLFLALVGFLMSLPKRSHYHTINRVVNKQKDPYSKEPHSEIFDVPVEEVPPQKMPPQKKMVKKSTAKTTKFSPGKYVASKRSNIYHEPKCDWAKKIKKDRQVWFNNKEEAWEKGYRAHSCVGQEKSIKD